MKDKMIDKQYEHILGLQKKGEKILEKRKKEDEEKRMLEEKKKMDRLNKIKREMEEDRNEQIAQKQRIKIQQKKDDNNFLDNWKMRMKQLERDEKELQNKWQRNKEIQHFQLNQIKEKKRNGKKTKR